MALVAAGCGAPAPGDPEVDPLSLPERALMVETLPGGVGGPAALVVRAPDGFVLPWQDGDGVHVRVVGDDGQRTDRTLGPGQLLGAAAIDVDGGGVAIAVAAGDGSIRVHAVRGAAPAEVRTIDAALVDGTPLPALASDGRHLLLASTRGGEIAVETPLPMSARLLLLDLGGDTAARAIALGTVPAPPALTGDARGFVAGGTLLVAADGATAAAPGTQVRTARLFRRPLPRGDASQAIATDAVTCDGVAWLTVPGLVGWAGAGPDGLLLDVVNGAGHQLLAVGPDLTPAPVRALPSTRQGDVGSGALVAGDGAHLVWSAAQEKEAVFALLDAHTLRADPAVMRVRAARSGSFAFALASTRFVMAWLAADDLVRYSVIEW